jgi:hypothetical protein
MRRSLFLIPAVLLWAALAPAPASADPVFGVRGGIYADAGDPFLGAEALIRMGRSRWVFDPNVEYVFSEGVTYWTLNGDFVHEFRRQRGHYFWAGGGLAVVSLDPKDGNGDGNTDVGVNLLGGVGFPGGGVTPYIQVKAILKDGSELVLAAGIRF